MKQLTRMVQGVRIELDTELSDEALRRSPNGLWQKQALSFHFEDKNGKEIHSVNTRKAPHMESLLSKSSVPGAKPGQMHWSYTFEYLPQNEPYRFILDGYSVDETDGTSVTFQPSKLKTKPVLFQSYGDAIKLKDFTIESSQGKDVSNNEGTLHITGKLLNEFDGSDWQLKDSMGKVYSLTPRGGISVSQSNVMDWKSGLLLLEGGGVTEKWFQLRAEKLNNIPDILTLTRTVVNHRYTNVDWAIAIMEQKL
ncbi:hypothetical protein [Paenibacillus sp. UNC496MF]|uniref:hypothetical protein n=1 Tax=Paenibacillus sp. UNC496MF TaxID=1502753 RepID=UPI00116011AB|nr:hypothetical protein [Paenibacillus sp. UNC496MF]